MSSPIITPHQLRNSPIIGGSPMPSRPPTLDEVLPHYLEGLTTATARDLTELPALKAYVRLLEELVRQGMPKAVAMNTLLKVKIGVTENFINHQHYGEVMAKFAKVIVQLYKATTSALGEEDGTDLFLFMCEDRFALVLPV